MLSIFYTFDASKTEKEMTWANAEGIKTDILNAINGMHGFNGITVSVENQDGDYQVNVKAAVFNQMHLDVLDKEKKSNNTFLTVVEDNGPKVLYAIY